MPKSIVTYAGLNAIATAFYVVLVALFLSHTSQIFEDVPEKTALIPTAMILLLVSSASLTGTLVLGRPILWYLDGKKKESVTLLMMTVGFLFFFTLIAFLALAIFK